MSGCVDCLDNCTDPVSAKCVRSLVSSECLGLCDTDSLYEFEVAVLDKICCILDGTCIKPGVEFNCKFVLDLIGSQDKNLTNILQALLDGECSLRQLIQDLDDEIHAPFSFFTDCLSGLPTNPTRDEILNAALIKLCSVNTRVTNIENDYVKNSELCTKVAACLAGGGPVQENTKMPKFVAMPYHGPMTVFDSNGVGLSAFGYDKVYVCNGQTVGTFITPDYRGRSPLGANVGVPGVLAMDVNVNPSLPANAGYGINPGTKQGNYTNTLSPSQMPAHTHPVNDPGHEHHLDYYDDTSQGTANPSLKGDTTDNSVNPIHTTTDVTGITIGSAGNSQPHNNLHCSLGTIFIMFIP